MNVRYDPLAAQVIAGCGVGWTAIAADVQGDNHLTQKEFQALAAAAAAPATDFLLDLIVLMKRNKGAGDPGVRGIGDVAGCHVADVMSMASLLIPEQMDLTAGTIRVDDAGAVEFAADPAGPHRFALRPLAGGAYRPEILRRLLAANRRS